VRNKRLIIIFSVFTVLVLFVVIASAFFSLKSADLYLKNDFGYYINESAVISKYDGFDLEKTISAFKGKSVFFFDRKGLVAKIESDYKWLHVTDTEITFPSTIKLTAVERTPVFRFDFGGGAFFADKCGFVMKPPAAAVPTIKVLSAQLAVLDITEGVYLSGAAALKDVYDIKSAGAGFYKDCQDADITVKATAAFWSHCDESGKRIFGSFSEIPSEVESMTFGFDGEDESDKILTITTVTGARIIVYKPETDIQKKITAAYGVYRISPAQEKIDGIFRVGQLKDNGEYPVTIH